MADPIGRRDFLRNSAIGGVAGLLTGTRNASARAVRHDVTDAAVAGFELDEITIADLQERMQKGQGSAVQIAEAYLNRKKFHLQ